VVFFPIFSLILEYFFTLNLRIFFNLFSKYKLMNFRYDVNEPKSASNDRFILSKGHAAPILYAAWAEAGKQ
jgi:transketolase N-terminal domain/subunit